LTSFRRDGARVIRIGHRGAAALAAENTLRGFERAVELGVDFVEADVLDLADGTLVLAHSDDLLEVSHGAAAGRVRPLALDELREVAPELPTLEEALAFFAAHEVGLHLDLKSRRHGMQVAEGLRRHGLAGRAIVGSFCRDTLSHVRATAPDLPLGLMYPEDRHGLVRHKLLRPLVPPAVAALARVLPRRLPRWLEAAGAAVAMLHFAVLTRASVDRCHARGAAVWTWTVNSDDVLERVIELGVDGVITDDPRIFRATLTP
jgi:glycerophosphoryl diester phosphodiesterase